MMLSHSARPCRRTCSCMLFRNPRHAHNKYPTGTRVFLAKKTKKALAMHPSRPSTTHRLPFLQTQRIPPRLLLSPNPLPAGFLRIRFLAILVAVRILIFGDFLDPFQRFAVGVSDRACHRSESRSQRLVQDLADRITDGA